MVGHYRDVVCYEQMTTTKRDGTACPPEIDREWPNFDRLDVLMVAVPSLFKGVEASLLSTKVFHRKGLDHFATVPYSSTAFQNFEQ